MQTKIMALRFEIFYKRPNIEIKKAEKYEKMRKGVL